MHLRKMLSAMLIVGVMFGAGACSKENEVDVGPTYSIGPSGGWIRGPGLDLYFPEGSTGEDIRITIDQVDALSVHDGDLRFHGAGMEPYDGTRTAVSPNFRAGPGNRDWDLPITVVVHLDPPLDDTEGVMLLWTDGDGAWVTMPFQVVDTDSVAADTTRLGYFVAVRQSKVACDPTVPLLNKGVTPCWSDGDYCPCGTDGGSIVGRWEMALPADKNSDGCEPVDEDWCLEPDVTSLSKVGHFQVHVKDGGTLDLSYDTTKTLVLECKGTDGNSQMCTDMSGGQDQGKRTCGDMQNGVCECTLINPPETTDGTDIPYALEGKTITFGSNETIEAQAMPFCVEGDTITLYAPDGSMMVLQRKEQ